MNVYEAFDFNKVNNNNQQKTKALTKTAMDAAKLEAIKNTDISKVIYNLLGIEKPRGFKLAEYPKYGFPAFVRTCDQWSKFYTDIKELCKKHNWTYLHTSYFNGKAKPDKIPDNLKPEWSKYFDDLPEECYYASLYLSPDEGMMLLAIHYKNVSEQDTFLTFTGNKLYNTDDMSGMSDEEKQFNADKQKALSIFKKDLKDTYAINFPNYIKLEFNYDPETKTKKLKQEWDYKEVEFGKAIVASNVQKILKGRIINYWKKERVDNLKDPNTDIFHWVFISNNGNMKCDVCWSKNRKKAYIEFSSIETLYGKNIRNGIIKKPENAQEIYKNGFKALLELTEYITKEEYKEIIQSNDPFSNLLEKFKDKWIQNK